MKLQEILDFKRIPYFVCIGTSRVTLDSVAPLIGDKLKKAGFKVLGTSDDNIHAVNLQKKYDEIIRKIDRKTYQVIAIDAMICLTENNHIYVDDKPCMPGRAVDKVLPAIGEAQIGCNLSTIGLSKSMIIHRMTHQQPEEIEDMMKEFVNRLANIIFNTILVNSIFYPDYMFGAMLILDGKTIRQAGEHIGVPRATLHYNIHKHLPETNPHIYDNVCLKLIYNFSERHFRGGEATKQKYARRKAECQSCLNMC